MIRLAPSLGVLIAGLLGIAATAGRVSAQAGHGAINLECTLCHVTHSAPGPSLTINADIDVLCLSCHGPGGTATEAAVHSVTKGGPRTFSCIECHTPHSNPVNWLTGTNIKRVGRTWIDPSGRAMIRTPNSGDKFVVFESRGVSSQQPSEPSLHSFADNDQDGNSVYDGICEVCHTLTTYHRNNVSDPGHEIGNNCTDCHTHAGGFLPTGGTGCSGCHSNVKGSGSHAAGTLRRAVVGTNGDFQNSIGGHFAGTDPTDYQCIVCHAEGYYDLVEGAVKTDTNYHNKSSGIYAGTQPWTVDLRNVDSASGVFPVRTDPGSWPASLAPNGTYLSPTNAFKNNLTQFCLNCHDADGATVHQSVDPGATGTATDPFGIGATPMNLVSKFLTSNYSTHNLNSSRTGSPVTRTVNTNAYVNGWGNSSITECSDCHLGRDPAATPTYYHNAHGGRNLRWLLSDMNGLDQAFADTQESPSSTVTCFRCHRNTTYGNGGADTNFSRYPEHTKTAHMDRSLNVFAIACLSCHGGYETAGGGIHGSNAVITDDDGNGATGTYPAVRFTNGAALDYFGPGEGDRKGIKTLCSAQATATGNNLGCTQHGSTTYTPNY